MGWISLIKSQTIPPTPDKLPGVKNDQREVCPSVQLLLKWAVAGSKRRSVLGMAYSWCVFLDENLRHGVVGEHPPTLAFRVYQVVKIKSECFAQSIS